jgi:basic amino acid/polyamine antiporter, APA family
LLVISALFYPAAYDNTTTAVIANENISWKDWITSFGVCLIAVSFTYGGYQQTINFGTDVDRPSKNIPRSIFIGIAVIIALYLAANFAYYKIIGFDNMKTTGEIASVVVGKMFGPDGANAFSLLLFLSVLAYVNGSMLSNPRVMYAMSEDGVLPAFLKKKSEKKEVLVTSLTVFAVICIIVLFFADTFEKILSFSIFLDSFGMCTSAATIFMLRKRTKHLDGTGIYKMKLFPFQPIVFIAAYVFVCGSIIFNSPMIALTGTAVLAGFMILYFLTAGRKRTSNNQ